MPITLNHAIVDRALPKISTGLRKYVWLQLELGRRNVSSDREYQLRFKGFYRVGRGPEWQEVFFAMMERAKATTLSLSEALVELHARTGRVEASFASKLLATIDPEKRVIDSVVLKNLGLTLRCKGDVPHRVLHIVTVHEAIAAQFSELLKTANGRYLVDRFRQEYPEARITEVKMLDLVLWQTRTAA